MHPITKEEIQVILDSGVSKNQIEKSLGMGQGSIGKFMTGKLNGIPEKYVEGIRKMWKLAIGKHLVAVEMEALENFPKDLKAPESLDMRPVNEEIFKIPVPMGDLLKPTEEKTGIHYGYKVSEEDIKELDNTYAGNSMTDLDLEVHKSLLEIEEDESIPLNQLSESQVEEIGLNNKEESEETKKNAVLNLQFVEEKYKEQIKRPIVNKDFLP